MSIQSIRDKSCIKFSAENLEKSRGRGLSGVPLIKSELVKQNCEKWSLISEIMLQLKIFSLTLFVNMLSINVKEFLCTRVGLSIQGAKLRLWRVRRKSSYAKVEKINISVSHDIDRLASSNKVFYGFLKIL